MVTVMVTHGPPQGGKPACLPVGRYRVSVKVTWPNTVAIRRNGHPAIGGQAVTVAKLRYLIVDFFH